MMDISIGHLHSSIRLIEILEKQPLDSSYIIDKNDTFFISPASDVINLSHKCNWIEVNQRGHFSISNKGKELLSILDYEGRLRYQLKDIIISFQPTWCKALSYGRKEFRRYVSRDITQCFNESGLFHIDPSDMIVQWWDELMIISRSFRSAELIKSGRQGERLTLNYEKDRTGINPKWQSLESNFSGYDILSVISLNDTTPLQIEVKTSTLRLRDAKLHLSFNEWENAQIARAYKFHLWIINNVIQMAIIGIEDILLHIPTNNGKGSWESVEIPMIEFKDKFQIIKSIMGPKNWTRFKTF